MVLLCSCLVQKPCQSTQITLGCCCVVNVTNQNSHDNRCGPSKQLLVWCSSHHFIFIGHSAHREEQNGKTRLATPMPSPTTYWSIFKANFTSSSFTDHPEKGQWFYGSLNIINHVSVSSVVYSEKAYRSQKP